jgi:hypothetical protein
MAAKFFVTARYQRHDGGFGHANCDALYVEDQDVDTGRMLEKFRRNLSTMLTDVAPEQIVITFYSRLRDDE